MLGFVRICLVNRLSDHFGRHRFSFYIKYLRGMLLLCVKNNDNIFSETYWINSGNLFLTVFSILKY